MGNLPRRQAVTRTHNALFKGATATPIRKDRHGPAGGHLLLRQGHDQPYRRIRSYALARCNERITQRILHELGAVVARAIVAWHGNAFRPQKKRCGSRRHASPSSPSLGNELASQRIFDHHGFAVWGISALKYPEISLDHHGAQPASMVIVARRSVSGHADARFTAHRRHLPSDYEALVTELLGADPPLNGAALGSHPFPGPTIHEPVATRDDVGAEIVDVPANWPEAAAIITSLRQEGYRFSAFLPEHGAVRGADGALHRFDYIRSYRPPPRYRRRATGA